MGIDAGRLRAAVFAFLAAAPLVALPATARAAPDALAPLQGQTIRIVIANNAGSEADRFGRIFARHLEHLLPTASVHIQNIAGGSGMLGVKEVFEADGSRIAVGFFNSSVIFNQLVSPDETPFDLTQFHWIGVVTTSQHIVAVRKGLPTDPTQPSKPMTIGTRSVNSSSAVLANLLNAVSPLRFRVVAGVQSEQASSMLMAGDLDAGIQSVEQLRELLDSGDIVPILRFSRSGYGPRYDRVPALSDIVAPSVPPALVATIERLTDLGRMVAAAPATSPAAAAALQAAFGQIVADPAYEAEVQAAGFVSAPQTGEAAEAALMAILSDRSSSELLSRYRACGEAIAAGASQSCN